MRAGWTTLILLGAAVCAQGEPKDITIPSPVGKWVFEAKWHPGHPVGYTWNLKNISSGKVFLADSPSRPDETLPVRLSGSWSEDGRYLALNIYYGRIAFDVDVLGMENNRVVLTRFPRAMEKSMILPDDRKRWDGSGGANSAALSWTKNDTLTVGDSMRAQLANSDGSITRIDSSRDRTIRFTGSIGKVVSTDDPQY